MTYLHIRDQGLARQTGHMLGERRSDHTTADNVRDALRACGLRAAAQAMDFQRVNLSTALRVLAAAPGRRREGIMPVVDVSAQQSSAPMRAAHPDAIPAFA